MTSGDANDIEATDPHVEAASSSRASFLHARWLRMAIIVGIVLASFASALAIAYELALARVPRHRAALESLVRAQTGLDIRFNELALRWGWYGPEAVFRRVELGEPEQTSVLLRAPQLIVAIDAWRTARSGQLVAGRITLVAPDIDLERFARRPASQARRAVQSSTASATSASATSAQSGRLRVLERWKGGVVDLQGGTLRLPDPGGSANALTLQIRRAALRRSGQEWSGHALVFLPERLGRTARVVAQLNGDLGEPSSLSGALRFEGMRLSFGSWRGMLAGVPRLARNLPLSGAGDVTVDLTLKQGRVEKANGEVRAVGLVLGAPPWADEASRSTLKQDYLTADWRFHRRGALSQFQVEKLVLSRERKDSPLPRFTVEMTPGHLHGALDVVPMRPVVAIVQWLQPQLAPLGVMLDGDLENLDVDWNVDRPEGFRLAASARVEEPVVWPASRSFTLTGVPAQLIASENRLRVEIDAPAARLALAADPTWPLESLDLVSRISIGEVGAGWQVEVPRFSFREASVSGEVSGTLTADTPDVAPMLDLRGDIAHADVLRLQEMFNSVVSSTLGAGGNRVSAGHIENGTFELKGRTDALFPSNDAQTEAQTDAQAGKAGPDTRFVGAFNLRDALIPADALWPETRALEARIAWNGSRVRATIEEGTAGAFELQSVEAQWDASGERASRFSGRAHGRLEQALAWLRGHAELKRYAPHLQELVASGDALIDFDVTVAAPSTKVAESSRVKARVAAVLEGAQFTLAPDLPPVESLRGSIAYDGGRLQRSTLSATWLGGPLSLKVSERRDRRNPAIAVQAQGFVDARKLVALTRIRDLPEVSGEASWNGEFVYTPPGEQSPARWQGRADSTLVGVASGLPAPLAKDAVAALPLHVEITGTGETSELRATLGERVRTAMSLRVVDREDWQIERAGVRLGGGAVTLPDDGVVRVRGRVRRLDVPQYLLVWQQLRKGAQNLHTDIDIAADELVAGQRTFANASVQAKAAAEGAHDEVTSLRIEAPTLGVMTGGFVADAREVVLDELRLEKGPLSGTGNVRCASDLASCRSEFTVETGDVAAALASLGFRDELQAARGAFSGEITWKPRDERAWLESAAGTLSMRFTDGVVRSADDDAGRPFALLAVPALLGGMTTPPEGPAAPSSVAAGEQPGVLAFRRLEGRFQLREGEATTSDLHFDGDAEILVRGRTGLVAKDYDLEAWVLRGEDRIPTSVRRLASTPRVAAAWMSLRELLRGDSVSRSRVVLRLRGSWSEPLVTVE